MNASCWPVQTFGGCCLTHAIQFFRFAGCRTVTFAFLGSSEEPHISTISIDRNAVTVDIATANQAFPVPLRAAVNRIAAAAFTALWLSRPEWATKFGSLGRIVFDVEAGFRITGAGLGPKIEPFRHTVKPGELAPRGDPPTPIAKLGYVFFPRPTVVRLG